MPQTLNGIAVDDKHRQRDVEHTVPEDEVLRIGHNGGLACVQKQADQGLVQHAQDEEGRYTVHAADAQCGVHAAVHTAKVFRAHILAGVGGHGGADALQRHAEELRSLAAGGLRRHDVAAQTIHRALQHHATDGGNAALQAHGDAHRAKFCTVRCADAPFFLIPAQLRVVAHDIKKAADARHSLTEHGGKGRAEHAHVEHNDAGKVQPDVQHTGHQQEIQRALAVAQCTHQGAGHIIKQSEGDACKNGADIHIRKVNDIGRGVRPHQHQTGHSHRNDGKHRGKGDGQPHGIGGVAAHLVVVVGTEGP